MSYESTLALRLTPYVAGEQPKNVKLIKLNTNENPYPPSPKVAEAIADQFPDTSLDVLEKVTARHRQIDAWNDTPVMQQEALERLETVMEQAGELKREDWVDFDRLVDNSFAKKAAE